MRSTARTVRRACRDRRSVHRRVESAAFTGPLSQGAQASAGRDRAQTARRSASASPAYPRSPGRAYTDYLVSLTSQAVEAVASKAPMTLEASVDRIHAELAEVRSGPGCIDHRPGFAAHEALGTIERGTRSQGAAEKLGDSYDR